MSEHQDQKALIDWTELKGFPYNLIFAIPNGGLRRKAVAGKLKAEGVKAGVPDLFLPVPRKGFHGLFIELKIGKNKPTKLQLEKFEELTNQGYLVVLCYGWQSAMEAIENYLTEANTAWY